MQTNTAVEQNRSVKWPVVSSEWKTERVREVESGDNEDGEDDELICVTVAACSTVVAQDHRRSCLPRRRCKSLEHAAAGDHVTVVTGGIQAHTEDGTVP